MSDQPRPAVVRSSYVSANAGEVEQFLRDTYTDVDLALPRERDGFRFRHETLAADGVALSLLGSSLVLDVHAAPLDRLVVGAPRGGGLSYDGTRYGEVRVPDGGVCLVPPTGEYRNVVEPADVDMVVLDPARLADYAAHTCGIAPAALDFTGLEPVSDERARHWRSTSRYVHGVLADPTLCAAPIVVASTVRTLSAALIATFPNSARAAMTDPHRPGASGDVCEATLRHVLEFLHEHADEPIGPAEVADVADSPYLDVVETLRRRRESHPARLLWLARLRGAHRDLRDGDPSTAGSVRAVAARWGFAHPGTFAVAHTAAFGESPEDTRRRSG
jgi:AraC-like DNA-binding protein